MDQSENRILSNKEETFHNSESLVLRHMKISVMEYETFDPVAIDNEEDTNDESFLYESENIVSEFNRLEDRVQDDLDLIALVEGNPRLYSKGKAGYRNVQDKDLAWISIGKALTNPLNGPEAKHRWETLRNLYGRARREILTLSKQQECSGSGRDEISYDSLLTPQSKAIHRFMSRLYIPRRTVSNYVTKSPIMSNVSPTSCYSQPCSTSKNTLSSKSHSTSFVVKTPSQISPVISQRQTTPPLKNLPVNLPTCKQNVMNNIPDKNENIDGQENEVFKVPKSDIRKRKKTDAAETESAIIESSQAIAAACSALPALINATNPKANQDEEEGMVAIVLHGLKRVPTQQKTRCLIKLLEILESFQQD